MPDTPDALRPLSPAEQELVARARRQARLLYDGLVTPHRSCGIALAETFCLRTPPYQALRRGGLTGEGQCGAIVAGRLILGELLGDPDPTGAVTAPLRAAVDLFERLWRARIDRGAAPGASIVCNTLTGQFQAFASPERHAFCTDLATEVATCVAEALVRVGVVPAVSSVPG